MEDLMRLVDIYNLAIKKGIDKDPRSAGEIQKEIGGRKKEYRKLKGVDRATYDTEKLRNPYADTRILYGDLFKDIKTVMVGIDMESNELLAADRLNERGAGIDLVMAHHPEGIAWASLYDVMHMQVNILKKFGIPLEVAEDQMKDRIDEVKRFLSP